MKTKKIYLFVAVLTALMLVSTVVAVPTTEGRIVTNITNRLERFNRNILGNEHYNEIKYELEELFYVIKYRFDGNNQTNIDILNINESFIDRLKEFNIEILGVEKYTETRNKLENQFSIILDKCESPNNPEPNDFFERINDFVLYYFDLFIEGCITVFAVSYALFGHNVVGDLIGAVISVILLPLPVIALSLLQSIVLIPYITTFVLLGTAIDFEQLFYDVGLIGTALVCILGLPLLVVVAIGMLTVGVVALTGYNLAYCFSLLFELLCTIQ